MVGAEYAASETPDPRYRWLVAPVDGAANYLAGLPWYGYSLALLDGSGPVVG
ncbi:MAG: monophosphatase, partial [Pseudonocardiales bacterium]|nr:monophosphatase [Pseudonocardiales bacterium]